MGKASSNLSIFSGDKSTLSRFKALKYPPIARAARTKKAGSIDFLKARIRYFFSLDDSTNSPCMANAAVNGTK